jgi:hypothetical protein
LQQPFFLRKVLIDSFIQHFQALSDLCDKMYFFSWISLDDILQRILAKLHMERDFIRRRCFHQPFYAFKEFLS